MNIRFRRSVTLLALVIGGPGHVQTGRDEEQQQRRRDDGKVDAIHGRPPRMARGTAVAAGDPQPAVTMTGGLSGARRAGFQRRLNQYRFVNKRF